MSGDAAGIPRLWQLRFHHRLTDGACRAIVEVRVGPDLLRITVLTDSFSRMTARFSALVLAAAATLARGEKPDFNRDIRPILSNNCFHCHGPDEKERKGGTDGLRLDTAEGASADLGGYPAIVPGNPEKSEFFRRIITDDSDDLMPKVLQIYSIYLRLTEIEFTDGTVLSERKNINNLGNKIKTLRREYLHKQRELTIAKAESSLWLA